MRSFGGFLRGHIIEHAVHFFGGQHARDALGQLGRAHQLGGIDFDQPLAHENLKNVRRHASLRATEDLASLRS